MTAEARDDGVDRLCQDDLLGPVVRREGPRTLSPAPDFFGRFVRSIVSQQVSTAAAEAIYARLEDRCELTPAGIRRTPPGALESVGLSAQKAEYLDHLARAFEERRWSRAYFDGMSNEEVITELTAVKGVGVWTAKMQLIFSLARPDVFPVEDLGIRRGMETLTGEALRRDEMVAVAERWRPDRSLASVYLWEISNG